MTTATGHLAVIDMQRVFAEPDSPWATPALRRGGGRRTATAAGLRRPRHFHPLPGPGKPEGAWRAYYDQWPFALQPPDAPLWRLTDEFAAQARQFVDAPTFGKWTPELAERVAPSGRLVLAGVSTDCCVLSTALAAADAGAEVLVVADACAGVDDDSHAKALHVMDLYRPLIRVVTVAEAVGEPS